MTEQVGLSLTCAKPNKRPRRITDAMAREAARAIVDNLPDDIGDGDEAVEDILWVTRHNRQMDGYEIARDLERYKHWSCDMGIAETLDGFLSACCHELDAAVMQWANENPMEPPVAAGVLVQTPRGEGTIEEVSPYPPLSYLVLVAGHSLLIPFEDVTAA